MLVGFTASYMQPRPVNDAWYDDIYNSTLFHQTANAWPKVVGAPLGFTTREKEEEEIKRCKMNFTVVKLSVCAMPCLQLGLKTLACL